MDKDKKIEIQEKIIDNLMTENETLKKQLDAERSKSENATIGNQKIYDEMMRSKDKYDKLVEELEKLKIEYRIQYDMYRRLTEK